MITLGIFAKTFPRKSLNDLFQELKSNAWTHAHFNMQCIGLHPMPLKISPETCTAIRQASETHGVQLCGVSGTYNMAHPDPKVRQEGLQRLEVLAKHCKEIGTDFISLCTGSCDPEDKWKFHPNNASKEAWATMRASFEAAILIAEKYKIRLGIEPELANIVSSPQKALQLLREMQSPHLGIILDPANLFEKATEKELHILIDQAIDLLQDHIFMAHAKGRDAKGNFVAAGTGIIPFGYFIQKLKSIGFSGPLVAHGLHESEAKGVRSYLAAC